MSIQTIYIDHKLIIKKQIYLNKMITEGLDKFNFLNVGCKYSNMYALILYT